MRTHLTTTARERWAALQAALGRRLALRLFEEVRRNPVRTSEAGPARLSWSLALAHALAALVHGSGLAAGALGGVVLLGPWPSLLHPVGGAILVLLCIAARPRLPRMPDRPLRRSDYPALYQLSDRIGRRLGAAPIDVLAVSAGFNAWYGVAGWRRRRCVGLGSPLLAILTPAERVAVMAHELSHGVNGDPLRGLFLFGAVNTVATWAQALRPTSVGRLGDGLPFGPVVSLLAIPLELGMLGLSELVFLGARGLMLLVLRDSQRAEYLADLLAATVAGTAAMQTALEKTYLADAVHGALRTQALTQPDEPVGQRLKQAMAALPADELERYRQASAEQLWQVDATHPPTALRVAMLAAHPQPPWAGLLTDDELRALDAEVDRLVASTHRALMDEQLAAIHG